MSARIAKALLVCLAAFGMFGCMSQPSIHGKLPRIGEASQKCVDGALHNHPPAWALRDAFTRFQMGCRIGDPAACSLLGVMHERGLVVEKDMLAAQKLYARACSAGNQIGCDHLRGSIAPAAPKPELLDLTAAR